MRQQQTLEQPYPDVCEWVPSEADYNTITVEPLPIGVIAHFPSPLSTSRPHKCPLCDGEGSVPWFKTINVAETTTVQPYSVASGRKDCHGCNGQGIVWEPA